MAQETILQHWVFSGFVLPFLLVFLIVFGILEKTKFFGDSKKQLNAMIAFVIGLIFVGAISQKLVVANLILFLTVAIVTMFIALLLWGFVAGDKGLDFGSAPKGLKWFIGIVLVIAVLLGLLWAAGVPETIFGDAVDFLFDSDWSNSFWTNAAFVIVIVVALVLVLK
ncbi:MAG: hypothetical protein KJ905_02380, partial [Nanoarchaeota archaeon]|nr:hypothetical protein [Nanoarchaeota archaeon]